jgi:hypothetical protein
VLIDEHLAESRTTGIGPLYCEGALNIGVGDLPPADEDVA